MAATYHWNCIPLPVEILFDLMTYTGVSRHQKTVAISKIYIGIIFSTHIAMHKSLMTKESCVILGLKALVLCYFSYIIGTQGLVSVAF